MSLSSSPFIVGWPLEVRLSVDGDQGSAAAAALLADRCSCLGSVPETAATADGASSADFFGRRESFRLVARSDLVVPTLACLPLRRDPSASAHGCSSDHHRY